MYLDRRVFLKAGLQPSGQQPVMAQQSEGLEARPVAQSQ